MSENITDKELLAICNLSNLKMEFANLVKQTVQSGTETIYTNHTIYSLIKNELEGIEKRKEKKKNYDSQLFTRIKESSKNYTTEISEQQVKNIQAQLMKEYIEEISKDEAGNLGSFYSKNKNNKNNFIYSNKIDLQKEAPIIMEYYDRYQQENEEGKFLDEWEVVYGGDFYEILLDYYILTKSNFASNTENNTNEEMSIITSPTAKYNFKINEDFIFREDIILKKNFSHRMNFTFDLLSVVLPAKELREFVFVNTNYTRTPLLEKLFFISKPLTKTVETKTIMENANNTNIIEKFVELCCHKDNKKEIFGALNVNISLDIVDVKIVITKKKSSNDFIVAFKSSDSNEIIENLNKGVLNLDLLTFNALVDNIINHHISGNSQVNVYFTGYGEGATLATACFLTNNSIPGIKKINEDKNSENNNKSENNEDKNSENNNKLKINYQNRSFIGTTKSSFLELINFNAYDIEYVVPGSFSYTLNLNEDIKNFFDSLLNNMRLTDNIGLIAAILLKRSLFKGVYSAFFAIGGKVVVTLIIIYFVYSWLNRKRLENLESKFKKNEIIIKITDNYNKINKELFKYASIVDSYSKIPLIHEYKFEYDNITLIHEYINNFFKNIEEEKNKNNKTNKENKTEDNEPNKEGKNEDNKNKIELIKFKLNENKTISVPFIVAIKLIFSNILQFERLTLMHNYISTKFYFKNTIIFGRNYDELYFLKVNEKNEFVGIVKIFYEQLFYPVSSKHYYIKTPTFSFEKMIVLLLNTIFTAQEKYDENKNEIIGSNFIYFDNYSSKVENDETINNSKSYNLEQDYSQQQFYQEKQIKLNNTENTKYIPIDRLEQKYLEYRDKIPCITKEISKVKEIVDTQNYIYDIGLLYTEFIYFPYIDNKGMVNEKIREDFIGTVLRSIYREEIKYDTFDVNEDSEFNSYPLTGEVKEKNSRLNNYLIQRLKIEGKKICYPEHYNSMMELLDNDSSLIEKYYDIKVTDEHIKKAIIKFGILDKGSYDIKKIGFIYNQDKLYGRAIELVYYYNEETSLEDISTFGVCQHATLECTCGSKPGNLLVTSQNNEYSDEMLDATEEDKTTTGFGKCSITDNGCTPDLTKWEGISKGSTINGKKCLVSLSTIKCKKGGLVSIKEPNCKLHNN